MTREELKVNIIIKGDRIFLGVQATDCDPKMTTLQGNLQTALERIPSFVEDQPTGSGTHRRIIPGPLFPNQ